MGIRELLHRTSSKEDDGLLGFEYSSAQDIFFTAKDAWQRRFGYCRLYDEGAPLLSMIIDCEPIYFDYGGRHWMVEFWKGQYGALTGVEVGIYSTDRADITLPNGLETTLFGNTDIELRMSVRLERNGTVLFARTERHWWLTGFKLGTFSEPDELAAQIRIEFLSEEMRDAFVSALKRLGYQDSEIKVAGVSASVRYTEPRQPQAASRRVLYEPVQKMNRSLCENVESIRSQMENPRSMEELKAVIPRKLRRKIRRALHVRSLFHINKLSQKTGGIRCLIKKHWIEFTQRRSESKLTIPAKLS